MTAWRVPLSDLRISESDIAAVTRTYQSGWLSMGPRTEELEKKFAQYVGAPHAVAVANGTAALHLACTALGLGVGDEVIVPSLTFCATVNAVAYTGATPVFADIAGLDRPWLSEPAVESLITSRTRAVMGMPYGGYPGENVALRDLATRRGLLFLEDAAHGAGCRVAGRHLGTLGVAGAFSFFSNKNLAAGEGGMVVANNDELASELRLLRSHGMTTLTWDRHRGHASSYDVVRLGYNYRIDEARAALLLARLPRLDDDNLQRAGIISRYRDRLADVAGVTPLAEPPTGSGYHLFPVFLDQDIDREHVRSALTSQGIQTSVHYPPVHHFSIYRNQRSSLPVTDEYARRTLTLPLFAHMKPEQVDLVVDSLAAGIASSRAASREGA